MPAHLPMPARARLDFAPQQRTSLLSELKIDRTAHALVAFHHGHRPRQAPAATSREGQPARQRGPAQARLDPPPGAGELAAVCADAADPAPAWTAHGV